MQRKLSRMLALCAVIVLFGLMFQGCLEWLDNSQAQVTTFHELYNDQYADYMVTTGYTMEDGFWVKTSSPELTESKKEILRKKKAVLVEVYPLIQLYDTLMITGDDIPATLLPQILALLESNL